MKPYLITIRQPGVAPRRYHGLFADDWSAIESALDSAAATGGNGQPCGITVKAVAA